MINKLLSVKQYLFHVIGGNKMLLCLGFAFPCAAFIKFIQTYIYNDWGYLKSLAVMMVLNSLAGSIFALKKRDFSFYTLTTGIAFKGTVYAIALVATHILTHFTIDGESKVDLSYLHVIIMCSFIVKEGGSVFVNLGKLRPDVPIFAKVLKYLNDFNSETGQPETEANKDNPSKQLP